jgi:hypothetical protein
MMMMKSTMTRRSLGEPLMMAARLPTDFEDSGGVRPVGRVLMRRLNQKSLGVTSVQGTIGFGPVRMISRRSVGLTLGGTHSFGVASRIGTT